MCGAVRAAVVTDQQTRVGLLSTLKVTGPAFVMCLSGLQASSSGQVKAVDVSATKRPNSDQSEQPHAKKKKAAATSAACFW